MLCRDYGRRSAHRLPLSYAIIFAPGLVSKLILLTSNLTVHRHWAGAPRARDVFLLNWKYRLIVLAVISSAGVAVQTDNRMFVSQRESNEGTPH